jgi:hypothetical protein
MAFLDNSGDIILDAVLTDTGRMRLAKGDGSFRITKFALGDDEMDYSLYEKNNPNGSAFYDLQILQTPVFEAFTNNIASLNSRLISYSQNNILYLPVLKVNDVSTGASDYALSQIVQNGYILAVDKDTQDLVATSTYNGVSTNKGILTGFTPGSGKSIRVDQGIDNVALPPSQDLPADLRETQYLIELDNRFASLTDGANNYPSPSYIDDDSVAAYYLSQGVDDKYVLRNTNQETSPSEVIAGQRGTYLTFKLKSQLDVSTSDYLFNLLGTDLSSYFTGATVRGILTSIKITGLTTGASVEIPLMVLKKIS